jgi:class 3 adenylate cyclase/CHASE2 domain-containing sensor protein
MENMYYDFWHQFAQKRRDAVHTAVVAVDDTTLLEYQEDPLAFWAPYWAQAMDVLTKAGARAIGLDFIYTVSAEAWLSKLKLPGSDISRNYDSPLRAQLAAGDKILITHLVENAEGELELLLPPKDQLFLLPGGINDLGIANLYPDSDKLVRHFYPVFVEDPQKPGVAFGMQLALRSAGEDPQQLKWVINGVEWQRERRISRIGYVGPPGTVPMVSMSALLKPDALSDPKVQALKGRTIIIAANNAGTSDRHFTPYSRGVLNYQSDQMIGGEIHANIIETLLSGRYPRSLPTGLHWAYVVLWIALAAVLFLRLNPAHALGAAIALGILALVPAYYLFLQDWVLPTGTVHTGMGVAFLSMLGLRLTGEEKERARLKQMFGRYVSDDVVDTLLADADRPDLAGEERHVTVLFSDIRNFTTISEKLDAHEVVQMLNAYFSEVCEPILERGGMVNKYIGDAVMAVFGAPKSYPDHPRRALAAALEMVEVGKSFQAWMQQHFPDRGLPPFAIGVGLHTGTCVVGDIGSARRTEFTAIGDTVNAASRLEGVTKELGVWLVASAATIAAAGDGVKTGKRETVTVKGRAEPIEVFEVVALEPPMQSVQSAAGGQS